MKRNLFITFAVLVPLLLSCYKDIDMEKYRPEPDLVLNGVITADTAVMLSISRTKFFTDLNRYEIINDASVSLSINGVFREQMRWTADESFYGGGVYLSDYRPQTGDVVKIEATTKYGDAWVEETIPAKALIEEVTFSHRQIYDGKSYLAVDSVTWIEIPKNEITYRITFTDDAATTNYYLVRIVDAVNLGLGIGNLDFSSDPVFVEQVSVIEGLFGDNTIMGQGGRSFTDNLLNGQRYTLVVTENCHDYDYRPTLSRRVFLYAITESYFHYLTSRQMAADAIDNISLSTFGFAEPVRIFTNIQGGIGIMATSQYDMVQIDIKE
jgi:hypothetical protein